jgi:hypothetical protein
MLMLMLMLMTAGSLVDQWIDYGSFELESLGPKWLWMVRGYVPYDAATFNQGKEAAAKALKILDTVCYATHI